MQPHRGDQSGLAVPIQLLNHRKMSLGLIETSDIEIPERELPMNRGVVGVGRGGPLECIDSGFEVTQPLVAATEEEPFPRPLAAALDDLKIAVSGMQKETVGLVYLTQVGPNLQVPAALLDCDDGATNLIRDLGVRRFEILGSNRCGTEPRSNQARPGNPGGQDKEADGDGSTGGRSMSGCPTHGSSRSLSGRENLGRPAGGTSRLPVPEPS